MSNEHEQLHPIALHACCGPCSLEPTRLLREQGFEPVIFYANSNIHPAAEYDHRLQTLRTWAASEGVEVHEGVYDRDTWERTAGRLVEDNLEKAVEEAAHAAAGDDAANADEPRMLSPELREALVHQDPKRREARCRACYRLRFEEAAQWAKANGFDTIGTTLSVSPYQFTEVIAEELERAAERHGLTAHFQDFRPFYDEATRRSRALGMYRQNFCGCRISQLEAQAEREQRKIERAERKAAEAAAHAEERAEEERAREARRAERAAYNAKQARKNAVLKALRAQGDSHENE